GRNWATLPGNLALSVLLRPDAGPGELGRFALLAALSLAEALEAEGAPRLQLKWPNDVMLEGRKLGGILLDSGVETGRLAWLVIGFGANLAAAPDLPTATCLPRPIAPEAAALAVLARLDHWTAAPAAEIRRAWLERGPPLGAPLRLNREGEVIEGAFAGLSETGALNLQSRGTLRAFSTGDVLQGA
ncbi:MAG TPA: biotin--[acetyl-CoA-carboxylase] ligase, partial [Acetobacteraceae bacterium]|nr:biotin--[acetyl-CoA-carboxylase] ligase [Acetobacteraceae bacterium]